MTLPARPSIVPAPRRRVTHRLALLLLATAAATVAAVAATVTAAPRAPDAVTYAGEVAAILNANCVSCHRAGQVAPFALDNFRDAAVRAHQIAGVTASRYMPPWKPVHGYGEFRDERRLDDDEIALLAAWAAAGAPLGDPAAVPAPPVFPSGWQLGEPDEIVVMPEAFTLPASGTDVFRNFVFPRQADRDRHVRAVELRVDNPPVLHHAVILVDASGVAGELDARDPGVGFEEMVWTGDIAPPEGHFIGWTPGSAARQLPEGTYWSLPADADLVLEAHLLPTGKPERLTATLGLYYSDQPPTRHPVVVRLGTETVEIPAGEASYEVRDELVLPVDVEVTMLYPHAHYLCRQAKGWAELPDGTVEWLVRIDDWDFNWQESYQLREPLALPAGTRLVMEYVFDNSAANPLNPHRPPRDVAWGPKSADEMADLWIQAIAEDPADRERLAAAVASHNEAIAFAGQAQRVRLSPDDVAEQRAMAELAERRGDLPLALRHYQAAADLRPDSPGLHTALAAVLGRLGRPGEAAAALEAALRLDPENLEARLNLGSALTDQGRAEEGALHLRRVLAADPARPEAHYNLGNALARLGRPDEAASAYREAIRLRQGYAAAHNNLGTVLGSRGELDAAAAEFAAAIAADPAHADAHRNLGAILERRGDGDRALRHYLEAVSARGLATEELTTVGARLLAGGRPLEAIAHHLVAVQRQPDLAESHLQMALAWHALGLLERSRAAYDAFLRLRPEDPRRAEIERRLAAPRPAAGGD